MTEKIYILKKDREWHGGKDGEIHDSLTLLYDSRWELLILWTHLIEPREKKVISSVNPDDDKDWSSYLRCKKPEELVRPKLKFQPQFACRYAVDYYVAVYAKKDGAS